VKQGVVWEFIRKRKKIHTLWLYEYYTYRQTWNLPMFNACGKLPSRAEIPALPYCVDTFMTSKSIRLRKTHEVTSFPPMFLDRRHTTTFISMRKETLIHQSLCLKWPLELKSFLASQWCTWTHVSWYTYIRWAFSMNAEYFHLRQQLMVDLGNNNFEQIPKLLTSRKHSWLVWFGTQYLTDTYAGNISQLPMRSHTQTHPQSGCVPWILSILV
jgi:hypothetical protein